MIRNLFRLTICTLFVFSGWYSVTTAQSALERGKKWYNQRAARADSFAARPKYINKAIQLFEKSLKSNNRPVETTVYLLKSYYFKGMYVNLDENREKRIYEKGRELGEKMSRRHPDSVPIKFWYAANIGRWSKVHGLLASANQGTASTLRSLCRDIIAADSTYQGGGGYRILAQVYYYTPEIPLLMGWPSDRKALDFIEKAMNIAPDHPANRLVYAQILLNLDRKEEAQKHLLFLSSYEPKSDYLVEDRYVRYRARKLLQRHYQNGSDARP